MSKFKVGDRVRCLLDGDSNVSGKVGTILEDHDYPYIEFDENIKGYAVMGGKDGHCWAVSEDDLELVEEEKTYNFKVGDYVNYGYCGDLSGKIGCIHGDIAYMSECKNIDNGSVFHYPEGYCCKEHRNFMGYSLDDLKLVTQKIEEEVKTHKFKVGDRVRIISKSIYSNLESSVVYKEGEGLGVVSEIKGDGSGSNGDNCIVVCTEIEYTNGYRSGDYFSPKDLELVRKITETKKSDNYPTQTVSGEGFKIPENYSRPGRITPFEDIDVVDFFYQGRLTNKLSNKKDHTGGIIKKMKTIPNTLKRVLDSDLSAMYKVGFINGNLALTEEGEREVLNFLITQKDVKKAIADVARDLIKEEKENK